MSCGGKDTWPELVGMDGEEAAAVIRRENPCVGVHIVRPGRMVTMEYRQDRVRVWVDEYGRVKSAPHIG